MDQRDTDAAQTDRQGSDRGDSTDRGAPAAGKNYTVDPIPAPKPSQAEGDRETIEESLRDKETKGQF